MANCRTCTKDLKIEDCISIGFEVQENKSVLDLIKEWASIKVIKDDKLPQVICRICFVAVKSFTSFIGLIRKSDQEFKDLCKSSNFTKAHKTAQDIKNDCHNNINSSYTLLKTNIVTEFLDNKLNTENSDVPAGKDTTENLVSFKCTTCHKTFKKSNQYKTHMTVHSGEKKYYCKICSKSFARSYVLIYHMRVHTGEKKFTCNFCNKSFIHPSNLYKHKKIHTNTRNYKCEYCAKTFIQSEALKIHIRRIHTGEKPFLCEICSKSFSCQSALSLHKQDTHLEKETCPICKHKFSSRILKQHIERHRNKEQDIKKYICEQCGKDFSSEHNLKQHLLTHDGIKPYASQPMPCPVCRKLYSKRRVKSHVCIPSS